MIKDLPNFNIEAKSPLSSAFLKLDIKTFHDACDFIRQMPYGRNANKSSLLTIFSDGCGTCSTKHAVLHQLAIENRIFDIQLTLGIFKMTAQNTPEVGNTLIRHKLPYIPEAHNYLKYGDSYFDFTKQNSSPDDFRSDILLEMEIQPEDIGQRKIEIHQNYLRTWLSDNDLNVSSNLSEIWKIREQCIKALSNRSR